MSVINQNLLLTPEGYQISRSVRLRSSASAYFNRTPASAGNRKTWTWSGWVKLGALTSGFSFVTQYTDGNNQSQARITGSSVLRFYDLVGGSFTTDITWSPVYRDPSAWYHLMLVADTTQATNTNRIKFYVNGVQVTSTSSATWPTQNTDLRVNLNGAHFIGQNGAGGELADGYLTDVNFIDGQALTPSSFGETDIITGVWKPKKYAGTYGTNGFYLNFSDNSNNTAATIGKDWSGNGNNWTPNNISVTSGATYDSMLDVPTPYADGGNGRGNYAVASPVFVGNTTSASITNGNLTASSVNNSSWYYGIGTIFPTSGKWYTEITLSANTLAFAGIVRPAFRDTANIMGNNSDAYGYYSSNGQKYNGSATGTAYGSTWTTNDVIGVALDLDAGTLTFYKNGTTQGQAFSGISGEWTIAACTIHNSAAVGTVNLNFGQRPFAYTPPTGFKALNTQNLPDSTIKKGKDYFNTVTYTGTGAAQSITGVGFQPDLLWIKSRSNAGDHGLVDSVRGRSKVIYSDLTDAEGTSSATEDVTALNADGFSLGTSARFTSNNNGWTFAAWNWKESVSAGFDIVTYTGTGVSRTVSHSLGVAPKMIIIKARNTTSSWPVWHTSIPSNQLYLNLTNAVDTPDISSVNSSTFTLNTAGLVNGNTFTYVAYCFAEVAGYSKFGSYTGNGSADGPFVYLGFRPKFILVKRTDSTGNWNILDAARDVYNPEGTVLYADASNAEASDANLKADFTANGFKLRGLWASLNASGGTFVYAAFAENPFKNSLAR